MISVKPPNFSAGNSTGVIAEFPGVEASVTKANTFAVLVVPVPVVSAKPDATTKAALPPSVLRASPLAL